MKKKTLNIQVHMYDSRPVHNTDADIDMKGLEVVFSSNFCTFMYDMMAKGGYCDGAPWAECFSRYLSVPINKDRDEVIVVVNFNGRNLDFDIRIGKKEVDIPF